MPTVKKVEENKIDYDVQVKRAKQFKNDRVGFDAVVNGITIYGMIVFPYKDKKTGADEWGISFPQRKGTDNGYYNEVWFPISRKLKGDIIKQIDDKLAE